MPIRVKLHPHEPVRAMPGHSKRCDDGWLVCCQSMDEHRFDCEAVPPDKRGPGPARSR